MASEWYLRLLRASRGVALHFRESEAELQIDVCVTPQRSHG